MASSPASIPKGTRDFSPADVARRNHIFDTLKSTFQRYGYQPIETPAMENLSTLTGKYGEEGDKLLFKILNSGDLKPALRPVFEKFAEARMKGNAEVSGPEVPVSALSEKGLRYDLTVPFARYVVQHRNEITFPFKRYQIQPVWRADRPQKGRYREFTQCDIDVIGSGSLLYEAELIQVTDEIFRTLGLNIVILLNNRKILNGISEVIGEPERMTDITVAIDKLDKIGLDKVVEELAGKGVRPGSIEKLKPFLSISGTNDEKISHLRGILKDSPVGLKGLDEVGEVFDILKPFGLAAEVKLELSLARGLDYYTGAIIEVKARDVAMGSISGGGRYDDLTGVFGLPGVSGIGISYGAERICDVMSELNLFPAESSSKTKVLFLNFGKKEERASLGYLAAVRGAGINAEIYPEAAKIRKQMDYANARDIPFVVLAGEEEIRTGLLTLKNMATGEQYKLTLSDTIGRLKN